MLIRGCSSLDKCYFTLKVLSKVSEILFSIFSKIEEVPIFRLIILSHDLRFPTMWYGRPAKAQTSLGMRTD